ncbi:MAG TPA: hypothetical protein VK694_02400 [Verrucomicrobiae bacterium]|nr:hypothetical protein [Verrucomicrobiae bacterium]
MVLAQATQAPNNGASNAEDFQPPTRNPQTAPGTLQPGTGTQNASGQEILSDPNAQLSVPSTTTTPGETVATPSGSMNIAFIIIASIIIVAVAEYFFRRRDKRRPVAMPVAEPDTTILDTETQTVVPKPEVIIQPAAAPPQKTSTPKKKPPKKSKSKRKKK